MAKHRSDQQWASILSAFHRSGLSQAAFCRRRGLALSTFRLRLAAARRGSRPARPGGHREPGENPAALVEIPFAGPLRAGAPFSGPARSVPVEVAFPGGARVSLALPSDALPGLLAELHRLPRP